jgi:hypothetical protein
LLNNVPPPETKGNVDDRGAIDVPRFIKRIGSGEGTDLMGVEYFRGNNTGHLKGIALQKGFDSL